MVYLMAFCGLRVSELIGLNASDLDMDEGRVRVRAQTAKGRRTRFVDLPLTIQQGQDIVKPEVATVLTSWLELRARIHPRPSEEDPLFVSPVVSPLSGSMPKCKERGVGDQVGATRVTTDSVRSILRRAATRLGIQPRLVMPHRLRHYFGLTSAMAGVPTSALMRAMGHRSPVMTARYSEFADSERRWAFARADITRGVRFPRPQQDQEAIPIGVTEPSPEKQTIAFSAREAQPRHV